LDRTYEAPNRIERRPEPGNEAAQLGRRGFNTVLRLSETVALNPSKKPVQRFSNTQVGSEPFGKCSTLLLFSAGYKSVDLIRSAWKRFVLIVQPLQFHDSLDGPPG
jgi:hypothetical protein